jgi:hypothetical protein
LSCKYAAYKALILESSPSVDEDFPEDLIQDQMESLGPLLNNEADPSSSIPDPQRRYNYQGACFSVAVVSISAQAALNNNF